MRLSEWRAAAPNREAMAPKVSGVIDPVLAALGAEPDPHCWVIWGDDPGVRYLIMAITPLGLGVCHVRVNVPGEGPRASGKLVRWGRVQVGELDVEMGGGHRLLSVQLEQQVIRGVDDHVDQISQFIGAVFAAIDGRPRPDLDASAERPASDAPTKTRL